jgi:four helix bundle protein
MGSTDFTQLIVWQKAHQVRIAFFGGTEKPPLSRMYRLVDQMQTAAQSVPGNIAEGFGRRQPKDKARFHTISKGSAAELKDQLIFTEVCRILRRLIDMTLGG